MGENTLGLSSCPHADFLFSRGQSRLCLLLVAVGFLADSALSALERVGAQRILPRKNPGQISAQLISSRAAIRSPLSIKNAVRQKTIPRKPWALILLDLLVSFGGTQLWHLTLACLSFTVFVAPLVADMVCQAYTGLAYPPGLSPGPASFTKRHRRSLDLVLGWELGGPLWAV